MIRVLQVFGGLDRGGSETIVMNLYRNIDRDRIQFDFVTHQAVKGDYEDEIEKLGGRIFRIPRYKVINHLSYIKAWKNLLRNHPEWKIVHGHMYTLASIYLNVAKKEGRLTIAHSHNTSNGKGVKAFVQDMIEKPLPSIADRFMACSDDAGLWLFGEDIIKSDRYLILPNAIDVDRFRYNEKTRLNMRNSLNIEDKIVLGHVGRYNYQKNFPFLLELIDKLRDINPRYLLLQIGDGKENKELKDLIKEKNLEDSVKLLGVRDDIPNLMQAMDFFVFPSVYEGLGIVAVEAQASGLRCLVSDKIPAEVQLTKLVEYLPIDNGVEEWIHLIINSELGHRSDESYHIKEANYDIKQTTNIITKYYLDLVS